MGDNQFPSDKLDKFMLRFPEGMRARIKEAAEGSGRSMNAEIIQRLEQSFAADALADSYPMVADEEPHGTIGLRGIPALMTLKRLEQVISLVQKVYAEVEKVAPSEAKNTTEAPRIKKEPRRIRIRK